MFMPCFRSMLTFLFVCPLRSRIVNLFHLILVQFIKLRFALKKTYSDDDSGRDEVEEHEDPLPQRWIEYYRDKFNANNK